MNILDTRFAAEQTRILERDRARCIRINLENYRDQSVTNKPLETAQTPLESQL